MSRITRRSFVGQSLAAAGAISAAPGILRAQGANEKIGMAVVGCGGRGGSHIGGWLKDPRTHITALVEVDEKKSAERAKQIEDKQGTRPNVYRDMREAFADKSVDAISTATPNHWHALCGVWAMQAGKVEFP